MKKITKRDARKVLAVVDAGLVKGVGIPKPGRMCVEAAVCYALDLPFGDDPECVSRAIRALKINLNDAAWSSYKARAAGMRKLAILQLGTRENFDDRVFAERVALMVVRTTLAEALDAAGMKKQATKCRGVLTLSAASAAAYAASAAYADNAVYAVYAAADAADNAVYANAAARSAARSAAHAADAADADADKVLGDFAERVAEILIDMKVPAVKWLDIL
jgi:hypothetical protein